MGFWCTCTVKLAFSSDLWNSGTSDAIQSKQKGTAKILRLVCSPVFLWESFTDFSEQWIRSLSRSSFPCSFISCFLQFAHNQLCSPYLSQEKKKGSFEGQQLYCAFFLVVNMSADTKYASLLSTIADCFLSLCFVYLGTTHSSLF